MQSLEKQNADLVDKNASLEEEFRKVASFKPLLESYRNQIADLESRAATRNTEMDTLKFELEQTRTKLRLTKEEHARDSETLELYQERVRELELSATPGKKPARAAATEARGNMEEFTEAEMLGSSTRDPALGQDYDEDDDLADRSLGQALEGELDDAITGTTMTDLKIQIRKLKRELEGVKMNGAESSRVLVLENLLEDANRMKARYETDYLAAHREKLKLQADLEEIRSGKSMGDG